MLCFIHLRMIILNEWGFRVCRCHRNPSLGILFIFLVLVAVFSLYLEKFLLLCKKEIPLYQVSKTSLSVKKTTCIDCTSRRREKGCVRGPFDGIMLWCF